MTRDRYAFIALDWNGTVVPFFGLPAFRGSLEQVAELRAGGIPVFVVSSAEQSTIEADVARVGIEVDGVYGCGDKAPIFSRLRAQHGGPAIVLGDHPSDCRAALAAGLEFLQARLEGQSAFAGAERGFEDWAEVSSLLLAGLPERG